MEKKVKVELLGIIFIKYLLNKSTPAQTSGGIFFDLQ